MPKRILIAALCLLALAKSVQAAVYASGESTQGAAAECPAEVLPLPKYSFSALFGFCLAYGYRGGYNSGYDWNILDGEGTIPIVFGFDFRLFFWERWGIGLDMLATKINTLPGEYRGFVDLNLLYRCPLAPQAVVNFGAGYTTGIDAGPIFYGKGYNLKAGYEYIHKSQLFSVGFYWVLHRLAYGYEWQTSLSAYCAVSLWDEGLVILGEILKLF